MKNNFKDLTGKTFGKLTVIKRAENKNNKIIEIRGQINDYEFTKNQTNEQREVGILFNKNDEL